MPGRTEQEQLRRTPAAAAPAATGPRQPGVVASPGASVWKPEAPTAGEQPSKPAEPAAEAARTRESEYRGKLAEVAQTILTLENAVAEYRRMPTAPTKAEIERLNADLRLAVAAFDALRIVPQSSLTQLQIAELRDRLFELELSVGIMNRRWGDSWKVFGLDFFAAGRPRLDTETVPIPENYRIRPGDRLTVTATGRLGDRGEQEVRVDASGYAVLPGAGRVKAAGKTARQLEADASAAVRTRFSQVDISIYVAKIRPISVQVAGDVARPGTFALPGTATLLDALCEAGGPTKSGTLRRVALVRRGQPRRTVDLYDFLIKGNKKVDLPLEDGDLIFVPSVGGAIVVEGEVVRPGRYEPDFPITLGKAIALAGGTSPGGYLPAVQVERVDGGQYRVLVDAPLSELGNRSELVLNPGDQVTVRPIRPDRTSKVEISGPVGAPGIYGFQPGMKVSDLLKAAQGLAQDREVYGKRADILRVDSYGSAEILSFDLDKAINKDEKHDLALCKLDRVFIYEPEQVVYAPCLVTILGAVARPGSYKRTQGMRVSDVVAAAGGLSPYAYVKRADLTRYNDDGTTTLVRVDLESALTKAPEDDIALRDRDALRIYSIEDVQWQDKSVRIEGAVQRPGIYRRAENMRLSDLLFASGNLLPEAAGTAEISRLDPQGEAAIVKLDLSKVFSAEAEDPLLEDRDIVTVPRRNPALRSAELVTLEGEVTRPGPYAISNQDRLLDVIERAGGLTDWADKRGVILIRRREYLDNEQQIKDIDLIMARGYAFSGKQFLSYLAKTGTSITTQTIEAALALFEAAPKTGEKKATTEQPGAARGTPEEPGVLQEAPSYDQPATVVGPTDRQPLATVPEKTVMSPQDVVPTFSRIQERFETAKFKKPEPETAMGPRLPLDEKNVLATLYARSPDSEPLALSARVSIDLEKATRDRRSADNIPLRPGDRVVVTRTTNVVTVYGAVLHPHSFAAELGQNVQYYIDRSGGYAKDAAKDMVVVIRPNGDAYPWNRVRSVEPGDSIVVPTTGFVDVARRWERIQPITKVISDILSSVFILTKL